MKGKICHVVGNSSFGGGSMIVLALAKKAASEGLRVHVVATDREFIRQLTAAGIGVVPLDCIERSVNPYRDVRGAFMLYRHFKAAKYDLVHTHTTKAGMIGRFAATAAKVPHVVHTVHGFAFHEESGRTATKVIAALERIAAGWCHRIVCVSRFHREWALRLHIAAADKIVAIPNGINAPAVPPGFDRATFRRSLGVDEGDVLVVGVGRLAPQKGFSHLIDAAAKLGDLGASCRFLVAGEGPLRSRLERRIVEAGLTGRFRLLGYRGDVGSLYLAADIVAQPSLWEGLSISLLEAMSLGRPIVTTEISSNREVVGQSGSVVLVPAADSDALAAAIRDLVADADRRAMISEIARSVYRDGYTEAGMTDAYLDLYREMLLRSEGANRG
ncbi:MAG: glycosyltransferase family 4 protein [Candidatus Latescibacteria bacterium]|nr:glycosyltransferase family 4 protein [Candidatus Latescibacterota bacterium]